MIRRASLPIAVRPWLGGAIISFSGIWVRLADVEPSRSALLRTVYALPALALMVALARRRGGTDGRLAPVPWLIPLGVVSGVLLGLDLIAWHAAIGILGAGLGTVMPNLQVVFVGLAGVLLFRERPRRAFWIAIPLVVVGILVLGAVGRPISAGASVAAGLGFGVLAALMYSGSLVVLRIARARSSQGSGVSVLFSMTVGAAAISLVIAMVEGVAGPAGWPADGWLLLLALGSQVVGWSLVTSSIAELPAALTSVALLVQPVLGLVWGVLLLGEHVGIGQFVGAGLLLIGVFIAHRAIVDGGAPGVRAG